MIYVLVHNGAIIGPGGLLRTPFQNAYPFWTEREEAEQGAAKAQRHVNGQGEVTVLGLLTEKDMPVPAAVVTAGSSGAVVVEPGEVGAEPSGEGLAK